MRAVEVLPVVQSLELPRPVPPDLFEINEPGPDAPVLVTGNSEFTLTVVTGLLALTVSPFYLLLVDTRGDTVDMSMIYRSFTPQRLDQGLETHRLADEAQAPAAHHPRGGGAPERGTGRLSPAGISGWAPSAWRSCPCSWERLTGSRRRGPERSAGNFWGRPLPLSPGRLTIK